MNIIQDYITKYRREERRGKMMSKMEVVEDIIKEVTGVQDLWRTSRKKEQVYSRFVYWYIMYIFYKGGTLTELGRGKDHSTVLHGIENVKDAISYSGSNPELLSIYLQVVEKLK